MVWTFICCGYFLYQISEKYFNRWTDRGQWSGFVYFLGNISLRTGQNDRKTLSACLKIYQAKWGSGHIGNNELTSLQLIKKIIWRETRKDFTRGTTPTHSNVCMKH